MDGLRKNARNDVPAVVAREFEPTRIEHQLLAQTFDLVCKAALLTQEAATNWLISQEATSIASDPPAESSVAGRSAA